MKRLLLFLPLLAILGMFFVFDEMLEHDPTELQLARQDQPMPPFQLQDLADDARVIEQTALQGKPRLLNVWATWCPSCMVEHPYLVQLAEEEKVAIVGLNYKDERQAALEWLELRDDPYEFVIYDPQGTLGLDLGVYGAPETYVIDAQGIIRYRHVGVVNEKVWKETLEPLMRDNNAS